MATIVADSCSLAHVSAAIASASNGDTISVPAGSATWTARLSTITKGLSIMAAGAVNITSTWVSAGYGSAASNALIAYVPAVPSLNESFRFSGFNITSTTSTGSMFLFVGNSTTNALTKIRVDHNTWVGSNRRTMGVTGTVYGCIDNNSFDVTAIDGSTALVLTCYGLNATSWNSLTFNFGSANQLYFEDNTVNAHDTVHDGGAGGRYCCRYNAYTFHAAAYPMFDLHGNHLDATGNHAGMGIEVYENTFSNGSVGGRIFDHRGGRGLFYNNTVTTTASSILAQTREEYNDSLLPPATASDGESQHVCNSYYFNNTKNGTTSAVYSISSTVDYGGGIGAVPQWDVDCWKEDAAFDGSSGVGIGLLAARPASGLTVGVGYWATDVLNDDGTYGRLYRATTSTTWALYYIPYEYPHPLRGEQITGFANTFTASVIVSASETARLYVDKPHVRIVPGTDAVYQIHVDAYNDFTADVTLDATGLPTNATDAYGTNPIAYSGSTTATIATTNVTPGTYSITFTGTAVGGEVGSVRVILEVVASDDCAPKVPVRKIRVKQGDNAVFTVNADPTAGYSGEMDLSASGVPAGASGLFADATIAYNESTTYTVDSGTAEAGEHVITITGEGPA